MKIWHERVQSLPASPSRAVRQATAGGGARAGAGSRSAHHAKIRTETRFRRSQCFVRHCLDVYSIFHITVEISLRVCIISVKRVMKHCLEYSQALRSPKTCLGSGFSVVTQLRVLKVAGETRRAQCRSSIETLSVELTLFTAPRALSRAYLKDLLVPHRCKRERRRWRQRANAGSCGGECGAGGGGAPSPERGAAGRRRRERAHGPAPCGTRHTLTYAGGMCMMAHDI